MSTTIGRVSNIIEAMSHEFAARKLPRSARRSLDAIAKMPNGIAGSNAGGARHDAYVKLAVKYVDQTESVLNRTLYASPRHMRSAMKQAGYDAATAAAVLRAAANDDSLLPTSQHAVIEGAQLVSRADGILDRLARHAVVKSKVSVAQHSIVETRQDVQRLVTRLRDELPPPELPRSQAMALRARDEELAATLRERVKIMNESASEVPGLDSVTRQIEMGATT